MGDVVQQLEQVEARLAAVEAELAAKNAATSPINLESYLELCHNLSLAIKPITEPSSTTRGETTKPVGRKYPQQILPWEDFAAQQESIWKQISESPFPQQESFPSKDYMKHVLADIKPISSEDDLRTFETNTVEGPVEKIFKAVGKELSLQKSLRLPEGGVVFEKKASDRTSLPTANAGAQRKSGPKRHTTGNNRGLVDQFCKCLDSSGAKETKVAIEYKAPHKLSVKDVCTGLSSGFRPFEDVINQNGVSAAFKARRLAAAVVTQLFSYMLVHGLQYGYVSTGETFVFLHIPENPATVFYHVSVPNDENVLRLTAVAQVFVFILQALQTEQVTQDWHDRHEKLALWPDERDDSFGGSPSPPEEEDKEDLDHKGNNEQGTGRNYQTRSKQKRSNENDAGHRSHKEDEGYNSDEGSHSPSSKGTGGSALPNNNEAPYGNKPRINGAEQKNMNQDRPNGIEGKPYCTHKCLIGLAYGGPLDYSCPNAASHGRDHISLSEFQISLRAQLAIDRGPNADCVPLNLSGATGSLIKVRLSAFGYTLVAKGVKDVHFEKLKHENMIYEALRSIQGRYIPVCLGLIDLNRPYYYDGNVLKHFLLLSWAGRPLSRCDIGQINEELAIRAIQNALTSIHELRVLHCDAEPRNILYDTATKSCMVTDFGEAKLYRKSAAMQLSPISPNRSGRKRKFDQNPDQDPGTDIFKCEFDCATSHARSLWPRARRVTRAAGKSEPIQFKCRV